MESQYNNIPSGQWSAPQGQRFEGRPNPTRTIQQRATMQQQSPSQKNIGLPQEPAKKAGQSPKRPAPMPKARTLALVSTMKKWLVVSSFISFGTLGGLIAYSQLGSAVAATATTTGTTKTTTTTKSSTTNGNNFFQQGGTNIGTATATPTTTSTTTGSGSSTSNSTSTSTNTNTTSSTAVSGTSASPSN